MAIQAHTCSENLPLLPMTNPDNASSSYSHFGFQIANASCTTTFAQALSYQLEKERMDLDYLINSQNELLRQSVSQYTSQQFASMLRTYEANAAVLLKQKDEEIAKANTRTMELEEFLRKMELENQAWQRMAMYNETVFVSLTNTLSHINNSNGNADLTRNNTNNNAAIDDAESCCEERWGENNGVCRRCNARVSSVIFLPCRHLCSCETCEPFMAFCPVCTMLKKSILQALI